MNVFELFKQVNAVEPEGIAREVYELLMHDDEVIHNLLQNASYDITNEILLIQDKLLRIQDQKNLVNSVEETVEEILKEEDVSVSEPSNTAQTVPEIPFKIPFK